jgi:riboflavin synthase
MFSGIVQEIGSVNQVRSGPGESVVTIQTPRRWRLSVGESVAVEGVCSTVQASGAGEFRVVYMRETLRRTTLGELTQGSRVNLERSLRLNDLVGGHLVQGHVDAQVRLAGVRRDGGAWIYKISVPQKYRRFIVEKGSVALDGTSLTVAAITATRFTVSLLEFTLEHTTLGGRKPGDRLNLEVDLMAKYAAKLLSR